MRWVAIVVVLGVVALARAQTLGDVAARGECSTAGTEGIDEQLLRTHRCLFGGMFVPFTPHPNITLASSRVYPLASTEMRDRIRAAADTTPLTVTSAFRTLAQQFVLYESGACPVVAEPGSSNHETGRAVDLANSEEALDAMTAAGCAHPLPDTDPVHFECGGPDMRMNSVLAFQRLWNANTPDDRIAEDGLYGPQTGGRLRMSPAGGFPIDVGGCEPDPPDAGVGDAGAADAGPWELADGDVRGRALPPSGCTCSATGSHRGDAVPTMVLVPRWLGHRRRRGR